MEPAVVAIEQAFQGREELSDWELGSVLGAGWLGLPSRKRSVKPSAG